MTWYLRLYKQKGLTIHGMNWYIALPVLCWSVISGTSFATPVVPSGIGIRFWKNDYQGSAFVESTTGWSDHTIIPSELDATETVTSGSRSIYIFISKSWLAIFYELGYFSTRMELIFWHVLILGKLSQYSFWEAEGLQCHSTRARRSRTVT